MTFHDSVVDDVELVRDSTFLDITTPSLTTLYPGAKEADYTLEFQELEYTLEFQELEEKSLGSKLARPTGFYRIGRKKGAG